MCVCVLIQPMLRHTFLFMDFSIKFLCTAEKCNSSTQQTPTDRLGVITVIALQTPLTVILCLDVKQERRQVLGNIRGGASPSPVSLLSSVRSGYVRASWQHRAQRGERRDRRSQHRSGCPWHRRPERRPRTNRFVLHL